MNVDEILAARLEQLASLLRGPTSLLATLRDFLVDPAASLPWDVAEAIDGTNEAVEAFARVAEWRCGFAIWSARIVATTLVSRRSWPAPMPMPCSVMAGDERGRDERTDEPDPADAAADAWSASCLATALATH